MGNTVYKSSCSVSDGKFHYKLINDDNGRVLTNVKLPITEADSIEKTQPDFFKDFTSGRKTVEFCLTDPESFQRCAGLFYKGRFEQYSIRKSTKPCVTPWFRAGAVVHGDLPAHIGIKGKKCDIVFTDYDITPKMLTECCYEDSTNKCNQFLANDFQTSHCDLTMLKNCEKDPTHPRCIKWLESAENRDNHMALEFYSNWCKENHSDSACTYLCKVARKHPKTARYCDEALVNWCQKNPNSRNCRCIIVPKTVENIKTFVGPKECWLSECVSAPTKWLTTEQLYTKKGCNLTACLISIEQLALGDEANVKLINDCVSGLSTQTSAFEFRKQQNSIPIMTPGIFFSPELALVALSGTLLFLLEKK
ncbi:putative myristylated membrane protein 1 [Diachasmimorpha longicaudata entomopoxvirus]|uniref:Putative myristylated membrane protein 1 n=1 Tax=Diachasmimorpha longicaudata entomopoxvirus TaxID=109981 RepID=A0A7R5WU43_9POXV|nr:putative myristylated membrane protein 1 [Diachasmimorpha longicaudata entomopoxvirus]AKS26337.1 putative myristylated membrane protein 1 [Diachasmimorpha longicaudata entomopoxvirus]